MDANNKVGVTVFFRLPFCLYLNDGSYSVSLNSDVKAEILLKKVRQEPLDMRLEIQMLNKYHIEDDAYYRVKRIADGKRDVIKGLELKDVEAAYEIHAIEGGKHTRPELWIPPYYYNCELERDERGTFRFTEVSILIKQIEWHNSIEYLDIAIEIINRLIDVYRYVTKEYHVRRITAKDIMAYSCSRSDKADFIYGYSASGIVPIREDFSETEHLEIKRLLKNNEQIPICDLMLLDAENFLELRDYRRTVIESIIAIEPWIEKFVEYKLAERRVSNIHIKDFLNVVTLAPQIKGLLKLLIEPEDLDYQLIDDLATINKIRNNIIHEGYINVSRSDAEKAINCTTKIISFIRENIQRNE
jgi:hypothetical protein